MQHVKQQLKVIIYTVTLEEANDPDNLVITMSEQIIDTKTLLLNSKYGKMLYGDDYILSADG